MISTEDSIIRLIMALILGGLIGYERQAQRKSAGLRTHTLVCVLRPVHDHIYQYCHGLLLHLWL